MPNDNYELELYNTMREATIIKMDGAAAHFVYKPEVVSNQPIAKNCTVKNEKGQEVL